MVSRLRAPRLFAALATSTIAFAQLAAQVQTTGQRWTVNGSAVSDFETAVDYSVAHSGHESLRIAAKDDPDGMAGVMTTVPATGFVAGVVRVTVWLRAEALQRPGASVWARVDGATVGQTLALSSTTGKQVIAGDLPWKAYTVDVAVPQGARTIVLGAFSQGRGRLWVDDVSIDLVDDDAARFKRDIGFESPDILNIIRPGPGDVARSPREPARPLTNSGRENLVAFTRLTGYVRFFYPGDSALKVNWDEFTIRGMRSVESASSAAQLADTMRALFSRVAPEVVIDTRRPSGDRATGNTGDAVLYWQHCGLGVPANQGRSVYRSVRHRVQRAGGLLPDSELVTCGGPRRMPVPNPTKAFVADLGAGVFAAVPLALGTAGMEGDATWTPRAATETFSVRDRATRLGDVALLWMVMQHFYPYFDVVQTDWNAALRSALSDAAITGGGAPFDTTMWRLIAALRDGHGNVFRQVALGVPAVRLDVVEGKIVVIAADSATGAKPGDEVLAMDGVPAAERLRRAEELVSGATPQWRRYMGLQRAMMGSPGDTMALTLASPRRELRLPRKTGVVLQAPRPAKIAELRPGIFYVDFDRVSDTDMVAIMPKLAAARGVVFDMRGYPRGVNTPGVLAHLSADTLHSARFEMPLVIQPDHAAMLFTDGGWTVPPQEPRFTGRVAFLTGGGAISYAESTMGVVEENHLGAIIGETTAGTNGNVNPFALPGGYNVAWTGMRVRKRDGTPHHGVGIKPTIEVKSTVRGIREGKDEVLERALQYVDAKQP